MTQQGAVAASVVSRPHTWLGAGHHIVRLDATAESTERADELLLVAAHRAARDLSSHEFGDPGCFTLLFSGSRTRRRAVSHVHVFLLPSVRAKRWLFVKMLAKPLLRWLRALRWPDGP